MWTRFPLLRQLVHFERRDQRHRAASIVAAGHRRAVEVVAPRRAGAGARTDVDHSAIVGDVRGECAPASLNRRQIGRGRASRGERRAPSRVVSIAVAVSSR